jgi:cytochrome oxidase assembly protein ShyY1
MQYKFHFDWRMFLFTAAFFPFLIALGLWQLEREHEKLVAEKVYETRSANEPTDVSSIDWTNPDLNWIAIRATGFFDNTRQLLLDNRTLNSVVGYEVISPFYTDDRVLLVNRGWIAQGPSRQSLPELGLTEEQITITGHIYVPDGELMILGAEEAVTDRWPKVIQSVDIQVLSSVMDEAFQPHIVRLDENSTAVLQTNWTAINMRPEVHRAYAVQWFVMASVLMFLYLFLSIRKLER